MMSIIFKVWIGSTEISLVVLFHRRISAKILGNILENGLSEVLVLDTRESDDFETAHIEGAVIYPARR